MATPGCRQSLHPGVRIGEIRVWRVAEFMSLFLLFSQAVFDVFHQAAGSYAEQVFIQPVVS